MKLITTLAFLCLSWPLLVTTGRAQFRLVTLFGSETITLGTNEVAEIVQALFASPAAPNFFGFRMDGREVYATAGNSGTPVPTQFPIPISGPRTIGTFGGGLVSLRVHDRATYQAARTSVAPASTVVIPTEPSGTAQVILESSADLVTWTAAQPGIYGSASTNRFFRLRVERAN